MAHPTGVSRGTRRRGVNGSRRGGCRVSLAGLFRIPGQPGGSALQAQELASWCRASTPSSGRPRRTVTASASVGTATSRRRACSPASSLRGTTGTCVSSRRRRPRDGSSRTSAPPRGRQCSRPTATRSATTTGCGCTTARSSASRCVKRELAFAVDPALFPLIEGSTDSELFFYLALTFGLLDDPVPAVAQGRGTDRGRRAPQRCRVPDPDDRGHHRRGDHLGVPLLQRGTVAFAVPQQRHRDAAGALPGEHHAARALRRRPAHRLGAPR